MVKIRLKRMGQKKAPFYRIPDLPEMEDSLKKSEHMILQEIQANFM